MVLARVSQTVNPLAETLVVETPSTVSPGLELLWFTTTRGVPGNAVENVIVALVGVFAAVGVIVTEPHWISFGETYCILLPAVLEEASHHRPSQKPSVFPVIRFSLFVTAPTDVLLVIGRVLTAPVPLPITACPDAKDVAPVPPLLTGTALDK